jgi:hypothetical protein
MKNNLHWPLFIHYNVLKKRQSNCFKCLSKNIVTTKDFLSTYQLDYYLGSIYHLEYTQLNFKRHSIQVYINRKVVHKNDNVHIKLKI